MSYNLFMSIIVGLNNYYSKKILKIAYHTYTYFRRVLLFLFKINFII